MANVNKKVIQEIYDILLERFGEPIGDYVGEELIGVRDERKDTIKSKKTKNVKK